MIINEMSSSMTSKTYPELYQTWPEPYQTYSKLYQTKPKKNIIMIEMTSSMNDKDKFSSDLKPFSLECDGPNDRASYSGAMAHLIISSTNASRAYMQH